MYKYITACLKTNIYEHCRSNPFACTDKSGLCAEDAWEKLFNFKFDLLDLWQGVPNANFNPQVGAIFVRDMATLGQILIF